jgi:hypothetical protein
MHLPRALLLAAHSGQLNIGASYNVTAHRFLLTKYRLFLQPIPVEKMTPRVRCPGCGLCRMCCCDVLLDDSYVVYIWFIHGSYRFTDSRGIAHTDVPLPWYRLDTHRI